MKRQETSIPKRQVGLWGGEWGSEAVISAGAKRGRAA